MKTKAMVFISFAVKAQPIYKIKDAITFAKNVTLSNKIISK